MEFPRKNLIASPANPRIKRLRQLRDRRHRNREGFFLVEGLRELSQAIAAGMMVQELYVCPEAIEKEAQHLVDTSLASGCKVYEISKACFQKLAMREGQDGLIAVFPLPKRSLEHLLLGKIPLVLVVDRPEKPGNLGALLRTADAAGIRQVIVCGDGAVDLYNPNTVRASLGALFTLEVVHANIEATSSWLSAHGMQVVAAGFATTSQSYWQVDWCRPTALVLGSEAHGLDKHWYEYADVIASIPMAGAVDSLNLSVAGALMMYEAIRQRTQESSPP